MEILSNFSSPYCFISFILGAMFMFVAFCIVAMGKVQEPMNKVQFFVKRTSHGYYSLYIKGKYKLHTIVTEISLNDFGLSIYDFADMKNGEMREVFLNLED